MDFYWQLCDADAEIGTTFRQGDDFDSLVEALRDLTARTHEHAGDDEVPSGNVAIYWSVNDVRVA
jgi:hypothetical protein